MSAERLLPLPPALSSPHLSCQSSSFGEHGQKSKHRLLDGRINAVEALSVSAWPVEGFEQAHVSVAIAIKNLNRLVESGGRFYERARLGRRIRMESE